MNVLIINDPVSTIAQRYMVSPGSVEDLVKRVTEICSLGVDDVMVFGLQAEGGGVAKA